MSNSKWLLPPDDTQIVLVMTIEVAGKQTETMKIRTCDDPDALAVDFVAAHKLRDDQISTLAQNIRYWKEMAINTMEEKPIQELQSGASTYRQYGHAQSRASSANYGDYLYKKGLNFQDNRDRRLANQRRSKLTESHKELSFKPNIHKNRSPSSKQFISTMYTNEARRRRNLSDLKFEVNSECLKECTFSPRINARSARLDGKMESPGPRFQDLYIDSFKRKLKNQEIYEAVKMYEHSFAPQINGSKTDRSETQAQFSERMMNSREHIEYDLRRAREQQTRPVDQYTGQKFFYPHGKMPTPKRTPRNVRIQEPPPQNPVSHYVNNSCIRQIQRLFAQLDSDKDGQISATSCDLSTISNRSIRMLQPLLMQLENSQRSIGFEEFRTIVESIVSKLNLPEKAQFFTTEEYKPTPTSSRGNSRYFEPTEPSMFEQEEI